MQKSEKSDGSGGRTSRCVVEKDQAVLEIPQGSGGVWIVFLVKRKDTEWIEVEKHGLNYISRGSLWFFCEDREWEQVWGNGNKDTVERSFIGPEKTLLCTKTAVEEVIKCN